MKRSGLAAISWLIFSTSLARGDETKPATLDDLKKLDIICFVPAYLPKDFKLKSASIKERASARAKAARVASAV